MSTGIERQVVLTPTQIRQKITRIAYEVYERNLGESEIIVAGINGGGYEFAKRLASEIRRIAPFDVKLLELKFDIHSSRQSAIEFDTDVVDFDGKVVIVTDVVLNTARTMTYALQPFLQSTVKKLQVAVIVDRSHRVYPVSADYVGYSLSTTINNHIEVILSDEDEGAYLR